MKQIITPEDKLRILNADFKIRIGLEVFNGATVHGAALEFPCITFNHHGLTVSREVAWLTLLHCLNENKPIIIA